MILYTALLLRFTPSLTAAIPPNNYTSVVAVVGEQLTLSCPLQFMESFGQFYNVEWRLNDIAVADTDAPDSPPCPCLNRLTLALTVGPIDSSLPKEFSCVIVSFQRLKRLIFDNVPKGTVNISLASKSSPTYMDSVHIGELEYENLCVVMAATCWVASL